MQKKKNKKRFMKIEKMAYKYFVLTTVILVVGIIYSRATLGKINLEVQKLSGIIKSESEDNQSLVMKINEMVSLDKIQKVSTELGLTYNNNNIKSVTECDLLERNDVAVDIANGNTLSFTINPFEIKCSKVKI